MNLVEANRTIRQMMNDNGLNGWNVRWVNTRSRAGQCKHGSRELNFSAVLLKEFSDAKAMNTITHEIAHALVGPGQGHGYVWQAKHRSLGGNGMKSWGDDDAETTKAIIANTSRWAGVCMVSKERVYFLNRLTKARERGVTPCRCHNEAVKWMPNN